MPRSAASIFNKVYPRLYVSGEVYAEIAVAGAGKPGASELAKSDWIEVKPLANPAALADAELKFGLGLGELSTVLLAREVHAEIAVIDDLRARRLALNEMRFAVPSVFWNCFIAKTTWPISGSVSRSAL